MLTNTKLIGLARLLAMGFSLTNDYLGLYWSVVRLSTMFSIVCFGSLLNDGLLLLLDSLCYIIGFLPYHGSLTRGDDVFYYGSLDLSGFLPLQDSLNTRVYHQWWPASKWWVSSSLRQTKIMRPSRGSSSTWPRCTQPLRVILPSLSSCSRGLPESVSRYSGLPCCCDAPYSFPHARAYY